MKKKLIYMAALVMLAVACNNEDNPFLSGNENNGTGEVKMITETITATNGDANGTTRADVDAYGVVSAPCLEAGAHDVDAVALVDFALAGDAVQEFLGIDLRIGEEHQITILVEHYVAYAEIAGHAEVQVSEQEHGDVVLAVLDCGVHFVPVEVSVCEESGFQVLGHCVDRCQHECEGSYP